jgi:hypothetical protein
LLPAILLFSACGGDEPSVTDQGSAIDTTGEQALKNHLAYLADDARPTWNEGDFFGEKSGR